MGKPGRKRNPFGYSVFENDDDDFSDAAAPPSKKPRVKNVTSKKEKSSKKPQKAVTERLTLDERRYQRNLEVALALSAQHAPVTVHASQSKETFTGAEPSDAESVFVLPSCSGDSNLIELEKITDVKNQELGIRCQRVAASKAKTDQRKLLIDDSDSEEEYMPDLAFEVESESDSDFSDDDVELESALIKYKKPKDIKKKKTKLLVISEKTKSTKSSSKGASGSSNIALGESQVKSPNQSLRLGLSRFAKVKPLHPSDGSS